MSLESDAGALLDRALAAKEVAIVACIALLAHDDPELPARIERALTVCETAVENVRPKDGELDAGAIARQAIIEALDFYAEGGIDKLGGAS